MRERKSRQCRQNNQESGQKMYAEVKAIQPKDTSNAHTRAPTKTMSDMDLHIRKSVKNQGVSEDPEQSKAGNLVSTTDVVNGIIEGMGVASHISELRRLGKFNSDRKKSRT